MRKDDYEDIYEQCIGFRFTLGKSGKLSNPDPVSADFVSAISDGFCNEDFIYIYCDPCDELMDFQYGPTESMDGKWCCIRCGRTVREVTPYRILDRLNSKFEDSLKDDYEDYYGD